MTKAKLRSWQMIGIGIFVSIVVTGELIFHHRDQHIKRAEAAIFLHNIFASHFGDIEYIVRRKMAFRSISLVSPTKSGQLTYFISGSRVSGELTLSWEYQTDMDKWEVRSAIVDSKAVEGQFPIQVSDQMVDLSERMTIQDQWWPSHRRIMIVQKIVD